jgi:hypothetical protein
MLFIYRKLAFLHLAKWDGKLHSRFNPDFDPESFKPDTDNPRTLKDDEFNLVLVALVEYLGHSNPIVSGVAFNEASRCSP